MAVSWGGTGWWCCRDPWLCWWCSAGRGVPTGDGSCKWGFLVSWEAWAVHGGSGMKNSTCCSPQVREDLPAA